MSTSGAPGLGTTPTPCRPMQGIVDWRWRFDRGLQVLDLREVLDGVRGTYRLTDGHWTDRGTQLSAQRMADALWSARHDQAAAPGRVGRSSGNPFRPVERRSEPDDARERTYPQHAPAV